VGVWDTFRELRDTEQEQVDVAGIGERLERKVLRLELPWAAKVKPRRIEVNGA